MLAILDSGISGLGIARAIMERLPDQDILYFGDTARAPYGDKSPASVRRHAFQSAETLLGLGAEALVVVSHTIGCIAGDALRKTFDIPVLNPVGLLAQRALAVSRTLRLGVIGSRAVVGSGCYPEAIRSLNAEAKVYSAACPLLSALAAENWLRKPEAVMMVKKQLHPLKTRQIDTLVLGGNDYMALRDIIQRKIGKRVRVVDAGAFLPEAAADLVGPGDPAGRAGHGGIRRFLVSDLSDHLAQAARRFFNGNLTLTLLKPKGGN